MKTEITKKIFTILLIIGFCLLLSTFSAQAQQPQGPILGPIDDPCVLNPSLPWCDGNIFPDEDPDEVLLPDLKIVDIQVVDLDNNCVLEIAVEYSGTDFIALSFDVDVFFDLNSAPMIGELSPYYVTYTDDSASQITSDGDIVKVHMEIPSGLPSFLINVSALIDTTRTIDESNEGNNHWFNCDVLNLTCPF